MSIVLSVEQREQAGSDSCNRFEYQVHWIVCLIGKLQEDAECIVFCEQKSFLGFIFYNYLTFGIECSHCHFVSNNDFDTEVLLWQSYIEDGKRLQTENVELYQKIKAINEIVGGVEYIITFKFRSVANNYKWSFAALLFVVFDMNTFSG